jgi:hypothetical protein
MNLFQGRPGMWTGTGAFNVHMELARTANFLPDELWTFAVDVPSSGTFVSDGRVQYVAGAPVHFTGIGGPSAQSPNAGCAASRLVVDFETNDVTTQTRRLELVSAVDNFGRKLHGTVWCGGPRTSRGDLHSFGLDWYDQFGEKKPAISDATAPTTMTVTVAFTRAHTFDFMAEPEAAK